MSRPSLAALDWPRRTERLVIRPVQETDFDDIWSYRSRPDVCQWLGRTPQDPDDLVVAFTGGMGEPPLVLELDGRVIGDLMLRVGDGWAQSDVREQALGTQAEIGWVLAPEAQGRGLASEAVAELLVVCFDALGLRRVTAECFVANEPSWRLMERLGLRREGHHIQDSLHRELGWVDGYSYAILADEWRRRNQPRTQG